MLDIIIQRKTPDIVIQRPKGWGHHFIVGKTWFGKQRIAFGEVSDFQSQAVKERLEREGFTVEFEDE